MQLHRLLVEDDAVSPVIGVVLLVAIAVTMMAAIGAFVLGIGPGEQPPRGELSFAQESGPQVTINVESADRLFEEDVEVVVQPETGSSGPACDQNGDEVWSGSGSISVGPGPTIDEYDAGASGSCDEDLETGDEILVIWQSGDQSEILARHEVF